MDWSREELRSFLEEVVTQKIDSMRQALLEALKEGAKERRLLIESVALVTSRLSGLESDVAVLVRELGGVGADVISFGRVSNVSRLRS